MYMYIIKSRKLQIKRRKNNYIKTKQTTNIKIRAILSFYYCSRRRRRKQQQKLTLDK